MKNKLMLIGLTAMLSVGLNASVEEVYFGDGKVEIAKSVSEIAKPVSYAQKAKNALSSVKDSSVNGSKAVYGAIASGATATKNGIVNGSIATKNGIVNGTCATGTAVKYAFQHPVLAANIAYEGAKDFGKATSMNIHTNTLNIYKNTFGKELFGYKHGGAVVSTVVLAGLGYGTYKVYKNGYVSKMRQAISAKFAKKAAVVAVDETPAVAVKAPVAAKVVAKVAPKKVAKIHKK